MQLTSINTNMIIRIYIVNIWMDWPPTKSSFHRPAQDCAVGEWSFWSGCAEPCRPSVRVRVRQIERQASHSGERCPSLKEQSGCREYRDHQGKLCGQHTGTGTVKTPGDLANASNFSNCQTNVSISGPALITSLEFGKGRPKHDHYGNPLNPGYVSVGPPTSCCLTS